MRPVASEKRGTNNVLEWIVAWIQVFYYRLMWRYFPSFLLNKKNHSVPPEAAPAIVLPEDVYKTQRKDRFLSWFRGGAASADANLDAIFTQSYAEYWKEVQVKDNLLEQRWRRRLLIESTPRGNVIMYYDAFKRGFAYYADTFMPYGLLNAVAMKYVMTYSCRSFFVDEAFFFVDAESSSTNHLIRLEMEQDDGGGENKKKNKVSAEKKMLDGPFIKRAADDATTIQQKSGEILQSKESDDRKKGDLKEHIQNRFIHLGKIVNLKILPVLPEDRSKTAKATATATATATAGISSYKDYKFWQNLAGGDGKSPFLQNLAGGDGKSPLNNKSGSATDVFRDML